MTMLTGDLITVGDRPALRFERRLRHPIERVWRAVSEPAELSRWFVATVEWGPEQGETFEAYGQAGEVTEADPPRTLAWSWGEQSYRFDLAPDGDGTVLVFTHVIPRREEGAQHAAGWETYFARLDAHLEGGHLGELDAHENVGVIHEAYATRFDLDPALGRSFIDGRFPPAGRLEDGPRLRFRRRLPHPPGRVWRAIAEEGERAEWFPPDAPLEVTEADPPRLLVGTWFGDTLRFELAEDGDGTLLDFTHEFGDRETAARSAAGWDRVLARLHALLEGSPMGERESLEAWPLVHEAYAEAFGVDPELGRRALAEHPRR